MQMFCKRFPKKVLWANAEFHKHAYACKTLYLLPSFFVSKMQILCKQMLNIYKWNNLLRNAEMLKENTKFVGEIQTLWRTQTL